MSLRIEVLAGLFAAGLAAYLVYGGGASAANAGFSLTIAGMSLILSSHSDLVSPETQSDSTG